MGYCANCEVCLANKYELWSRKRANKTWLKRIRGLFEKLRSGKSLAIRQEKQNAKLHGLSHI